MSTESKDLIRRWFEEVWNKGREDAIDEMFAADGVAHGLTEEGDKTMRGPDGGSRKFVIVPCGLRVSVVGPADASAIKDKVSDVLEKGGYNVSDIGPAKAKRAATVVYADAANTAEAEKLAKTIPGGATVDKLTWKPKADIVVAVGDSAK
jgi:hypothetical protein